jgi:hypothetical protein
MEEIEKKMDAMIGESTVNEYKAYKNLVKHKERINHVFSEVCGENSFRCHSPGIDKKALAIVVASCSAAPPKAPRRKSSKKLKSNIGDTSSTVVCFDKTKSLESRKRMRKASGGVSEAEIQAASSPAQLGQKISKKAMNKISISKV